MVYRQLFFFPNGIIFVLADFSHRLNTLINGSGGTQRAVADQCDIAQASMSRYLSGRIPKAQELHRLAVYFGVSMEYLLTGEENGVAVVREAAVPYSTKNAKYRKKLSRLSSELEKIIDEME